MSRMPVPVRQGSRATARTPAPMRARARTAGRRLVAACALAVAALVVSTAPADAQTSPPRPVQLGEFWITYYWFVPESAFTGARILAKGLTKPYREDFLYSARGIAMQGTGTADDGTMLHWRNGAGAWVNKLGQATYTSAGGFTNGSPYARPGGCVWHPADDSGVAIPTDVTTPLPPTFALEAGGWDPTNKPKTGTTTVVCNREAVKNSLPDDLSFRRYPDTYGIGMGTKVEAWKSIATDLSVIPRGSRIYIEALKDTPAKGCFRADDTGGAIIGKHIDVLVPYGTRGMPSKGDLQLLPEGVDCPPPTALPPGPLGDLALSWLIPAGERASRGSRTAAAGVSSPKLREDFLYGTSGVVARAIGRTARGKTVVALGGGWWVNRLGRKTVLQSDGTWSKGKPFWRDGGWRTRKGRPTYRLPDGAWSNGRGVRYLRYRDRFRLGKPGEYRAWRSAGAAKTTAPVGTLLRLDSVPSAACLIVDRALPTLPQNTILVIAPVNTDPATLPSLGPATVLAAQAGTADGCPA